MLSYLLYSAFILACFVLVVAVLLQPGKADAGALFTSSVSSTAFGPRGTQSVLAKITIAAAATFLVTALLLTMGVGSGQGSIMDRGGAAPAASPTPATAAAPAASPAAEGEPAASPAGATAPAADASPAASPAR
ncbi:MAG TPA: preprotein translocase subunit SecG [Pyrinomonadaceae bacterium]|nr:preprotein translocase subunit SecG [Pyrinomonadaceae bacterium]